MDHLAADNSTMQGRLVSTKRSPAKDVHLAEADERDGGHASHGKRFFTSDEDVTSERRKSHITDAPGGSIARRSSDGTTSAQRNSRRRSGSHSHNDEAGGVSGDPRSETGDSKPTSPARRGSAKAHNPALRTVARVFGLPLPEPINRRRVSNGDQANRRRSSLVADDEEYDPDDLDWESSFEDDEEDDCYQYNFEDPAGHRPRRVLGDADIARYAERFKANLSENTRARRERGRQRDILMAQTRPRREVGELEEELEHALRTAAALRTEEQHAAVLTLVARSQSLSRIPEDCAHVLCRVMEWEDVPQGEVLMRQGDAPHALVLLLRGKLAQHCVVAELQADTPRPGASEEQHGGGPSRASTRAASRQASRVSGGHVGRGSSRQISSHATIEEDASRNIVRQASLESSGSGRSTEGIGEYLLTMEAGSVVGELSSPSLVSVVAEEDCIVCRMPVEAVPQDWLERLNENCAALRELTPFHREALRTPVLRRSPKHVALVQQLVGAYAFFQQFEPDVLYKLCARLMLEELEAPHVKLTQGQAGSEFSVIMEGRVAIFVDDDSTRMTKGGKKVSSERRRADRQAYTQLVNSKSREWHMIDLKKRFGKLVSSLSVGDAFGEQSLTNSVPCNATVITTEPTDLLVLAKEDFTKLISQHTVVAQPERLRGLLLLPPEQRTSRDVRYMAGSIPKSSFLNTVDTDTLHRLCRVATYRTLDAGRALFFQGVPGDSFYILLTGEIAIHQLHDTTPQTKSMDMYLPGMSTEPFGEMVYKVPPGGAFGEVALVMNKPRSATCIAAQYSQLMVISREDYNNIVMGDEGRDSPFRKRMRMMIFLSALSFCKGVYFAKLVKLSYEMELRRYQYGSVILHQNAPVPGLCFVGTGEVKLVQSRSMGRPPLEVLVLGSGEFFGESSIMVKAHQSAESEYEVRAATQTEIFVVPRAALDDLPGIVLHRLRSMVQSADKWRAGHVSDIVNTLDVSNQPEVPPVKLSIQRPANFKLNHLGAHILAVPGQSPRREVMGRAQTSIGGARSHDQPATFLQHRSSLRQMHPPHSHAQLIPLTASNAFSPRPPRETLVPSSMTRSSAVARKRVLTMRSMSASDAWGDDRPGPSRVHQDRHDPTIGSAQQMWAAQRRDQEMGELRSQSTSAAARRMLISGDKSGEIDIETNKIARSVQQDRHSQRAVARDKPIWEVGKKKLQWEPPITRQLATMLRPSTVHNSITRKPEVLNSLFNDVIVANDQGIVRRQVTVGMSAGKPVDSRPRLQILKPPSLGGLGHGLIPSSGQRAGSCFAMNQQHDRHRPSKPHFRAVADLREVKANSTIRH